MLHIRPWEQRELLTVDELRDAIAYVKRAIKEAEEAAEEARRR